MCQYSVLPCTLSGHVGATPESSSRTSLLFQGRRDRRVHEDVMNWVGQS